MIELTSEEKYYLLKNNDTVIDVCVPTHDSTLEEYIYIDVMQLLEELMSFKFRYDSCSH